jgi:hypothetical protein
MTIQIRSVLYVNTARVGRNKPPRVTLIRSIRHAITNSITRN